MNEQRTETPTIETARAEQLPRYEPPRIQVMTRARDPEHVPDHAVHGHVVDDVVLLGRGPDCGGLLGGPRGTVIAYGVVGERTAALSARPARSSTWPERTSRWSDDLELIDGAGRSPRRPPVPAPRRARNPDGGQRPRPGRLPAHSAASGSACRARISSPRPTSSWPPARRTSPSTCSSPRASRVVLAQRGGREPALVVDGSGMPVRPGADGWRKAVGLLLLQRLMRCREDAIFFHAAIGRARRRRA